MLTRNPHVLLIHGGGWDALDKHSIEPLARVFLADGRCVFNINYRLLRDAPWPACLEDCVAAGEALASASLSAELPASGQILVCGASAGGHLAMMAGLRLGATRVESIIQLCGPSRLDFPDGSSEDHFCSDSFAREFLGDDRGAIQDRLLEASPAIHVQTCDTVPPLMCIQSRNDLLVPPSHAKWAADAWRRAGAPADVFYFNGPGDSHGIWDSEDRAIRQPLTEVAEAIRDYLGRIPSPAITT